MIHSQLWLPNPGTALITWLVSVSLLLPSLIISQHISPALLAAITTQRRPGSSPSRLLHIISVCSTCIGIIALLHLGVSSFILILLVFVDVAVDVAVDVVIIIVVIVIIVVVVVVVVVVDVVDSLVEAGVLVWWRFS